MVRYINVARVADEATLLGRRWRSQFDARLRTVGLSHARWRVLSVLSEARAGLTQRELADRLGVGGPTVVRHVEHLQLRGLIQRGPATGDGRSKCVRLTRAGEGLIKQIDAIAEGLSADVVGDMTDEALESCRRALKTLSARLERR
ncbi:MarR family transcriptional regulator [uncultured Phenylobacterium sp.]|uniref:MarR family winged helix-turn-helix transcriptional regulator n=1 Tax=uncultured Phenylobacterium sp. TaxID=349273 RepID=UPI00260131FD|nr:MarR family transcriptional regulator [uncultured Phenylobacterium sp.]